MKNSQCLPASSMQVVTARQAIFDTSLNVIGYDLTCGASEYNDCQYLSSKELSPDDFVQSLNFFANITEKDQRLFVTVPQSVLADVKLLCLDNHKFILSVNSSGIADDLFMNFLARAKSQGYALLFSIAEDTFNLTAALPLMDFAKINFIDTQNNLKLCKITQKILENNIALLASGVDTYDLLKHATELGYKYFEGNFFYLPQAVNSKVIPQATAISFNLIYELSKKYIDDNRIFELIASDPILSFKLLKFINSPFYSGGETITSLKRAILKLGHIELLQWINLTLLSKQISTDIGRELIYTAAFRCRYLSNLQRSITSFCDLDIDICLPGLFSTLNALLKMPFEEIFSQLPCLDIIRSRLIDKKSRCYNCIKIADNFEKNDIRTINKLKKQFKQIDFARINLDAHIWAHCIMK